MKDLGSLLIFYKLKIFVFYHLKKWLFRLVGYLKSKKQPPLDLTLVGIVKYADGIGRIPIGITELLQEDLNVKCLPTNPLPPKNLNPKIQKALAYSMRRSRVSILTEQICTIGSKPYLLLPPSDIRISYSMVESTRIPSTWCDILNRSFDLVVVPDRCLIQVYENSGVKIPIFELPLGIELDPFFALKRSNKEMIPFVFGTTVSCDPRKNIPLLIQAFAEEFGNNEKVLLRINSRSGDIQTCLDLIDSLKAKNILFTQEILNKEEYAQLMKSFHCFVNVSMGEGFSICPREALALGIPCILTENTAHETICNTGFVRSVPCPIHKPAFERIYGKSQLGFFQTCHLEDIKTSLRDVYENYSEYLKKASNAKSWVESYQWERLKTKYLNLVRPKKVLLGDQNLITNEGFITNSPQLYKKYSNL